MDKSKLDDEKLITRFIKGDEDCLVILLNRHQERIFRTIMREVHYNRAFAEDVFQESLFKVVRALKEGNYMHQDYFCAWVERIAKNFIIDHHRKEKKMRTITTLRNKEGEYCDIFDVVKITDEKIAENEIIKDEKYQHNRVLVKGLIKKLPENQREVLMMRLYFDMSFNEIAEMLGVNLNTALGRMRYALINLQKIMQTEGIEVSKEKIFGVIQ